MPLDSNKIAHIQAVTLKTYASRQKTVVFVAQSSGTYSYTAVSVIFRPQAVIEPEIPDEAGGQPKQRFDMLMISPISTSFTGVIYVADTTTATSGAVASAAKYEIIETLVTGIVATGTHYVSTLRRFR